MDEISLRIMTRELCHQLYRDWENDPSIYMDMRLFTAYEYEERKKQPKKRHNRRGGRDVF